MKAIFLDIDGVLNCRETPNPRKFPYIVDPKLLMRFKAVVQRSGAKIVLSSTWRYDPIGLLAASHFGIPFMDITPDMKGVPRCREILTWLKEHPDVDRFVVIDDEDDELDTLPLFQPSANTGLTEEIVDGVVDYLDGKTSKDMRCNRVARAFQNVHSMLKGHAG